MASGPRRTAPSVDLCNGDFSTITRPYCLRCVYAQEGLHSMKKPLRNTLVALSCLFLFTALVALLGIGDAYVQRRQAERFLAVLNQVQVGLTDEAAVLRLTDPFRRYREKHLDNGEQVFSFGFANRGLYCLRLAPYTEFKSDVTLKDGVVVQKTGSEYVAVYAGSKVRGVRCSASVIEHVRGYGPYVGVTSGGFPNHIVYATPDAQNFVRHSRIEDDSSYGQTERHSDWLFNLRCLSRIGGCGDARLLLPNAVATLN